PYSVAMALVEYLGDQAGATPIQIFATDIADTAITHARAGVYPESIAADVSAERLRRFFMHSDGGYRISKTIRDLCVFARQDLTRDPPFSRLDLIVCRNVLIYLSAPLQKRLMNVFHYALKANGYLMLGSAETIGTHADLFSLMDKHQRVYVKKSAPMRADVQYSTTRQGAIDERHRHSPPRFKGSSLTVQNEANRLILERYSPPAVVIDNELQIVHFRGQTGRYLEPPPGEATLNVLKMARSGLLHGLRTAITEARHSGARVRREGLRLKHDGASLEINVEVAPVDGAFDAGHFLILFEEAGQPDAAATRRGARGSRSKSAARQPGKVSQLEHELAASREYLQSIIQDLEAANEELQSANEEILSSNEELQSTNEELDTAKEELQSTNEELNTVNDELHSRNEELSRSNSDLLNLLGSVQIAIVMVTSDLRIRRFTPMAEKVLNLIPADVGRRISDINPNIDCADLERLIAEAVDSVTTVEREVRDRQGTVFALRIRPYKSLENRIDGAILALFDIDAAQGRQHALDGVDQIRAAIIEGVSEPLALLDGQLRVRHANQAFLQQFALRAEQAVDRPLDDLEGWRWDTSDFRLRANELLSGVQVVQDWCMRTDGTGEGEQLQVSARRIAAGGGAPPALLLRLQLQRRSN
ncbi:MAG: CheR family methyltransferase, partial [Steroidobacteraceae bacterium]